MGGQWAHVHTPDPPASLSSARGFGLCIASHQAIQLGRLTVAAPLLSGPAAPRKRGRRERKQTGARAPTHMKSDVVRLAGAVGDARTCPPLLEVARVALP